MLAGINDEIGNITYQDYLKNMTYIQNGYEKYYLSMMLNNIGFDHKEFWEQKVRRAVEAYRKWAQYLYDYKVYEKEKKELKDSLAPVFEDVIIYEYIQSDAPKILYE